MIILQPTKTTRPRHRLPDSALSTLVLNCSKGIRPIRFALARHRPGQQHKSYICVWISTWENGVKCHGYCFVPTLIPNRQDSYATNQSKASGIERAVATRMSDQAPETIKIAWELKKEVFSFIQALIVRGFQ